MMGFFSPMVIGVTQLFYVIPAYRKFSRGPNPQWAKGVLIAAAITFLLNASCWGLMFNTKWDFK
jgi:Co/Zn/Cd efflux system component